MLGGTFSPLKSVPGVCRWGLVSHHRHYAVGFAGVHRQGAHILFSLSISSGFWFSRYRLSGDLVMVADKARFFYTFSDLRRS